MSGEPEGKTTEAPANEKTVQAAEEKPAAAEVTEGTEAPPSVESPAAESVAAEPTSAESPETEPTSAESPETESASAETLATESPAAEPTSAESPETESASAETLATESPAAESTSAESPQTVSPEGESIDDSSLMESMDSVSQIAPGEVVRGTVLKVTDSEVIVDVGLKCEGVIPCEEFASAEGGPSVQPNDEIDVLVEHYNEREGTVRISYRKVRNRHLWEEINASFRDRKLLKGKVIERVKGGLVMDVGLRAFLPGSQVELRPVRDLDTLLGQEMEVRVVKVNRKRDNVVVSRKVILEEELGQRRNQLREKLTEGAVVTGRVKNLTSYGAFIDLGGIDGLLHVTDLTWGRVNHPSELLQLDQEVEVKVLHFDTEKDRVSLGMKQLTEDPWAGVGEKYAADTRVRGRVTSATDYGAFVELDPGVEGLIHITEMTWGKRLCHPSKVVNLGDEVEVAILEVNTAERRISLSLKKISEDPWATLADRLQVGRVTQGTVRNFTDFGAFVEVEEGIDGLVHLSDLSWTRKLKHPSEVVRRGQSVAVVVLKVDSENRRLSLGLKQLQPDVWDEYLKKINVGDTLPGKIVRRVPFGIFVELEEGIEGLCHSSEIEPEGSPQEADALLAGRELFFRVVKLNPEEKKIGLSLRDVEQSPEAGAESGSREEAKDENGKPAPVSESVESVSADAPSNVKPNSESDLPPDGKPDANSPSEPETSVVDASTLAPHKEA